MNPDDVATAILAMTHARECLQDAEVALGVERAHVAAAVDAIDGLGAALIEYADAEDHLTSTHRANPKPTAELSAEDREEWHLACDRKIKAERGLVRVAAVYRAAKAAS